MQKFIACLTAAASAMAASAHAETLQFPDPNALDLPPEDTGELPRFPSPDNLPSSVTEATDTTQTGSSTTTQWSYTYEPAINAAAADIPDSTQTTIVGGGSYVYPQTSGSATITTTTAGGDTYTYPVAGSTATSGSTPASSDTHSYYNNRPNWSQGFNHWGNQNGWRQPFTGNTLYYAPGHYLSVPGSMLTPPPLPLPSLPTFMWSGANNQATTAQNSGNMQDTRQLQALTSTLGALRRQQSELVTQTQATLSGQEQMIADLKRQLAEARQGKGDLESKLTALQGELAESVKKAELESCKAEKDELAGQVTEMDSRVGAIAEISQQFAALKQNYAELETEKQQLAATLEAETKDIDADGIPDKLDLCLETPTGAEVDATGCEPPKDGDNDGITDEADQCPGTPEGALIDDKGCELPPPDDDRDGVPNEADQCPDIAEGAKVDDTGCEPDADKDGVPDSPDQCAETAEGPKEVGGKGCDAIPDEDQDGIADADDLCHSTAADAEVNQVGCSKSENISLKGVNFETGSAILTADSLPLLDEAADSLAKHPGLTIEVGGHTDHTGNAQANETLSQSRAEAVMKYLTGKGVPANLLRAKGYGPNQPIADNGTPDGRAQNRRVELKILNQ